MRFLADQDVYALTVRFLRGLGHDVEEASHLGRSLPTDHDVLRAAEADERILVTRDRDFGGLVFVRRLGKGVVYLRVLPSTLKAVHAELKRVIDGYLAAELREGFVVVEPGRHRFRRIPR